MILVFFSPAFLRNFLRICWSTR